MLQGIFLPFAKSSCVRLLFYVRGYRKAVRERKASLNPRGFSNPFLSCGISVSDSQRSVIIWCLGLGTIGIVFRHHWVKAKLEVALPKERGLSRLLPIACAKQSPKTDLSLQITL